MITKTITRWREMQFRVCKSVTSHTSHEGPHGLRSQPEVIVRIASAPYGRDAGWSTEGYPKATTTSTSSNPNLDATFNFNCRVCVFVGSTRSTWRSRPTRQAWNDSKHRMFISASSFFVRLLCTEIITLYRQAPVPEGFRRVLRFPPSSNPTNAVLASCIVS